MNTWRGFIVILVSALAAFAAMFGWLVLNTNRLSDPWSLPMFMELLGLLMATIFGAGKIAARVVIGTSAAQEMAASAKWRHRFVAIVAAVLLLVSRFAEDAPATLWTWDHFALMIAGGAALLAGMLAGHSAAAQGLVRNR